MAKSVTRKNLRQFGVNGNSNNFGQWGSVNASAPLKTKNVETIQALSAWLEGLTAEVVDSNKAPFLEDFNSMFWVTVWQLFYLLQEGVAEWNADTTYFIGSYVRAPGTANTYQSLTDDNLNNAVTDVVNWKLVMPVDFTSLTGSLALAQIPDGLITSAKIISLAASKISGLITDAQIGSVAAAAITGIASIGVGGTGQNIKMLDYAQWGGNGVNGRQIDFSMGFPPDIAFVWQIGGPNPTVLRVQSSGVGNSQFVSGGAARTDMIQNFNDAGLIIGTHPAVNAIGSTYGGFIIKHQFGS